jgi:hypothetical protein
MSILNFPLVLYSLLFYVLFSFLGLGLTIIFSPGKLLKYTVFLAPLVGYCLLTLAGWYFYILNFKGTDDYYYWILLLSLLFLIAAVIKIWKQRVLHDLFDRKLIVPIVIAIGVFLIVALPALRQEKMLVTVTGNLDVIAYTEVSKVLKEVPRDDTNQIIACGAVTEPIMGVSLNTAFFCSVAKLDPYQVQMISLFIFFMIALFLTYILAREIFAYTGFAANIIILLCGLSSLLFYVIYNGFECQIVAMPLMLLIILCNVEVARADKFKDAVRYVPFLILSFWGLSLTYSHMFVIIYGLVVPYVLLSWWKNRRVPGLLNWAAVNCIALLAIVCLAPQRPQMIISMIYSMGSVIAGWFIPWITPQKLYGIIPFLIPEQLLNLLNNIGVTAVISLVLIAVIVAGFVKLFKRDMENFLLSATMFILIFTGAVILSFLNMYRNAGGFGGYNQFKLISYFLPVILLSSFALFKDIGFNIPGGLQSPVKPGHWYTGIRKNALQLLVIGALVISNGISAGATVYATLIHNMVIVMPPDLINLQSVRSNDQIKSINIPADGGKYWNILWEAYFLFPRKLYFEQATYCPATPLKGEWNLIRNNAGAPVPLSEASGASVSGASVTFTWAAPAGTGTDSYYLRVNTNAKFTGADIYSNVVGNVTSYTHSGFSDNGATYYWYVVAHNSATGWGPASNVRSFITGTGTDKILSILPKTDPVTIQVNSTYSLRKSAPGFTINFGDGWSGCELDRRWTISDVASIIVDSDAEKIRTDLILRYAPLNENNSLAVYLNGINIMDCNSNNSCVIKGLSLQKGENIIEFKAKLPAELPGNGDPRKLCYSFELIQFQKIE